MLQQLESESWIQQAEALHYLGEHWVELANDAVRALLNNKTAHSWIRGRALLTLSQIENEVDPGEFGKWVAHDQSALRAAAVVHGDGGDDRRAAFAADQQRIQLLFDGNDQMAMVVDLQGIATDPDFNIVVAR